MLRKISVYLIVLCVALVIGSCDFRARSAPVEPLAPAKDSPPDDHTGIAYWSCSMHPSVRSATPGKCPICAMNLTPVTRGEIKTGEIVIDAQRRQLIGVTTGAVERRVLTTELRAAGPVALDETRLHAVTLRHDAWIGEVSADFTGKAVRKGEPMFTFYNPESRLAQQEYLEALRHAKNEPERGARMVEAAEARLKLSQIDDSQAGALRERGRELEYVTFSAPLSGTVTEKHIVAGGAATAGAALYRLADLSVVWIEAEITAGDPAQVALGEAAEIRVPNVSATAISGTISYIYPEVDPLTRRVRIRIVVPNLEGVLKPGTYAQVAVAVPLGERLVVPESAVIFAGATRLAFADLGEGRLEPRRLKTGAQAGGFIEVIEGLKEGETVVTSANFLIAAESRLKSGVEKW